MRRSARTCSRAPCARSRRLARPTISLVWPALWKYRRFIFANALNDLRHRFSGKMACSAAKAYERSVRERENQEAVNLARLTGWNIDEIRKRMNLASKSATEGEKHWWNALWQ